ncbi:MAG: RHS repeat-associated core domain-containing protein [bacterium]
MNKPWLSVGTTYPEAQNLRGQLFAVYDETGRSEVVYDFKGLPTVTRKRFVDPTLLTAHLESQNTAGNSYAISAYKVDWSGDLVQRESDLLEVAEHVTTQRHDALGRVTEMIYPRDVNGVRQVLKTTYNNAGALESATIDGQTRVENIAYNARGQRILLSLGNGVVTRYAYDDQNFRLRRMRAELCTKSGTTYSPAGTVFEDCGYHDDLDGNILALIDKSSEGAAIAARFAQPSTLEGYAYGLPTDAQIKQYTYDPLSRVLSSQGFEHVNRSPSAPWDDTVTALLADPNDVRAFNETYSYDKTSGLLSLSHTSSEGTSGYTRSYSFVSGTNRLASMTVGGTTYNYVYGPTGCMTKENTERHYVWDAARRLSLFKVQVSGSAATKIGQYLYDAGGERQVKIKSTAGRHEITYYLGAFELTRLIRTGQPEASNSLAFVHDAGTAIYRGRSGDVLPGESSRPAEQFTLSDHLSSASTTVDGTGVKVSREAYTAYGESTYGSFEKKRYRFTGKERDEESGLNYHSARYYAPWLGKWLSPDPSGFVDGPNLYNYVRGNPVISADPIGRQSMSEIELQSDDGGVKQGDANNLAQQASRVSEPSKPPQDPMNPKQDVWQTLARNERLLREEPQRLEVANKLYDHLKLQNGATQDVMEIYDFLRVEGFDEFGRWSPSIEWDLADARLMNEEYRRPTDIEMRQTFELSNRFIRLQVTTWSLDAAHDAIEAFQGPNDSIDTEILGKAWENATNLRQRVGVDDTPALVATEHYLVARGLLRRMVGSPMVTHVVMPIMVPGWDVWKSITPKLFKEFSDKPGSPRWMWVRAWGYYGSQQ